MRDLYLIRHGKPQYPDEQSYCIGQTDLALSMLGHLQAVLLHEELSDRISRVYYSPLARAAETAGHIAAELPHLPVSDLAERSLGEWDGLSFDTIRRKWPDIYEAREMILTIRFQEQKLLLHPVRAFHRQFRKSCVHLRATLRSSLIRM